MADYFVASGGSDTSPYDTWAKAATSLATALAAATTDGDRVVIQYDGVPSGDAEVSANVTYTAAAAIEIISSTNSGTADVTPTAMGESNWIGTSGASTPRAITLKQASAKTLYCYGLTFRFSAQNVTQALNIATANPGEVRLENCLLWQGTIATSSRIKVGADSAVWEVYTTLKNCTLRFGSTSQRLQVAQTHLVMEGCTISSSGSAPTTLMEFTPAAGAGVDVFGCDLSHVNTTLVGDPATGSRTVTFVQCKLPGSYVLAASSTAAGKAGADVWAFDCDSGDVHTQIGHANALGTTVIDTGIYADDNVCDSNLSWKIVGTAAATPSMPYESPWIDVYHDGTSAITPYLECVRSGSATAYQDDEVWSEWTYKGTSGSTRSTFVSDAMALAGTPADQASSSKGASDWTGEDATSWFGKLGPSSSITPAEAGHIRARVCVAGEVTVFVDPQIRGLS